MHSNLSLLGEKSPQLKAENPAKELFPRRKKTYIVNVSCRTERSLWWDYKESQEHQQIGISASMSLPISLEISMSLPISCRTLFTRVFPSRCPFRAGREEADIRSSHPSDTSVGHASFLEKVSMTSKWSCSSCEKGGTGQKGRTACSISTLAVKPVAVYQPSYLIVPPLPPVHQSHFQ